MTDEVNKTADIELKRTLESQKILQNSENEIERLATALDKTNMDQDMLRYKAIELAKVCYGGRYFTSTTITSMPKDDPANAIIAGFLQKMQVQKNAIQK